MLAYHASAWGSMLATDFISQACPKGGTTQAEICYATSCITYSLKFLEVPLNYRRRRRRANGRPSSSKLIVAGSGMIDRSSNVAVILSGTST